MLKTFLSGIPILLLPVLFCGCQTVMPPRLKPKPKAATIVFVHGFNGHRAMPPFRDEFRRVSKRVGASNALNTKMYVWDSGKLQLHKPKSVIPTWEQAKKTCRKEATIFARDIIAKYETQGRPYYLSAHSLGCRLVLLAIKAYDKPLTHCRGIYFLGAAVDANETLKPGLLPRGLKIINYYSTEFDVVLGTSYEVGEGHQAGGRVGFSDTKSFLNYSTTATHVHKLDLVYADWVRLVDPVYCLALWKEGVDLGGKTKKNLPIAVGSGSVWWNNVAEFDNVPGDAKHRRVLIQQHKTTGHYRAVRVSVDGKDRKRIAWGDDLHAILHAADVWSRRKSWP